MIDGLVFIWVEKEIIFDVIKIFEKQDMIYVENVCWVMLDENKKKGMLYLLLTFHFRGRRYPKNRRFSCFYKG